MKPSGIVQVAATATVVAFWGVFLAFCLVNLGAGFGAKDFRRVCEHHGGVQQIHVGLTSPLFLAVCKDGNVRPVRSR